MKSTITLLLLMTCTPALAQVDEAKVDEWFHGCKVVAADIGEHNAGTAADVAANWPSAETEDQVKAFVTLRHGLGRSISASSQTTALLNALIARAAAQGVTLDSTVRIVTEGESTTSGTTTWAYDAWPERLMRQSNWVGKGILINQAQASQTIAELASQYAAQVYPYRPTGGVTESWLIVMIGIKDSRPGGTPPAASTIMTAIESYMQTAQNDGFTTVLLTTNYSTNMTSAEKQTVLDLNVLILASEVPDHVVDTISALGQPDVTPANYNDDVHPNGDGYDAVAETINTQITNP